MPRFMPNERQAACSAFGRAAIAGPTSHAAANNSAVLARITRRYSSSVVAVFLAAPSCITSPSAITAAADERISSARGEPPAPHVALIDHVVVQQRGGVHELDCRGELHVALAAVARELRHGQCE